jgi:hypothetical protein
MENGYRSCLTDRKQKVELKLSNAMQRISSQTREQ